MASSTSPLLLLFILVAVSLAPVSATLDPGDATALKELCDQIDRLDVDVSMYMASWANCSNAAQACGVFKGVNCSTDGTRIVALYH